MEQISIFDGSTEFKTSKPIRLISFFSGYDSQALALKYLNIKFEHYKTCEWAIKSISALKDLHFANDSCDYSKNLSHEQVVQYLLQKGISTNYNEPMTVSQINHLSEKTAREIYNNIIATRNLVNIQQVHAKDLDIIDTDKFDYLLTYSFPCQDLSKAGKGKGMAKGGGTRSGMLWEVERILDESKNINALPQILLMENVPDVIGKKNIKHFSSWLNKLESLGYKCYWKVLNAKNYGIPQNRARCFMVSILGDFYYNFPKPLKLTNALAEFLEKDVPENFYLKTKTIKNTVDTFKENIAQMKDPKCVKVIQMEGKYESTNRVYSVDGLCPTINTCGGGNREPKILEKCQQVDLEVSVRVRKNKVDIEGLKQCLQKHKSLSNKEIADKLGQPITLVEHWFRKDKSFSIPSDDIWFSLKKLLNITTDKYDKSIMEFEIKPNKFDMSNRAYQADGLSPTITTANTPNIMTTTTQNYRIRKLTPKECFRLMGVKDEDYNKVAENQSSASLYHLAGDSIVVNVLMAIFKNLFLEDKK